MAKREHETIYLTEIVKFVILTMNLLRMELVLYLQSDGFPREVVS